MTDATQAPAPPAAHECKSCGDPIGHGLPKNVVYTCDRVDGEWCGTCFKNHPCSYKPHPEGCATSMICDVA